ncbi:MAG: hypothetical protein RL129_1472 [Actinomycetota bacterium]
MVLKRLVFIAVLRDKCVQDDGTRENMIMFAALRTDWQ